MSEDGYEQLVYMYKLGQEQERIRCARIARRHHLDSDDEDKMAFCSCGLAIAKEIEGE